MAARQRSPSASRRAEVTTTRPITIPQLALAACVQAERDGDQAEHDHATGKENFCGRRIALCGDTPAAPLRDGLTERQHLRQPRSIVPVPKTSSARIVITAGAGIVVQRQS
jgi:hypothetical protein